LGRKSELNPIVESFKYTKHCLLFAGARSTESSVNTVILRFAQRTNRQSSGWFCGSHNPFFSKAGVDVAEVPAVLLSSWPGLEGWHGDSLYCTPELSQAISEGRRTLAVSKAPIGHHTISTGVRVDGLPH